jgi:hypothetical protein
LLSGNLVRIIMLSALLLGRVALAAQEENEFSIGADLYGAHAHLMPLRGTSDDLSLTVYGRFKGAKLQPFARALGTNYYYLLPGAANYLTDYRTANGIGIDYNFYSFMRFRIIGERVRNRLSNTEYDQDSYGLIYNQYLEFTYFDMNNYAESFYIPRFSKGSADTFVRLQALKSYYLSYDEFASNTVYPFLQVKAKFNDDIIFGLSGQNASVGLGYKIFVQTKSKKNNFSALIEANSLFYQSKRFDGDWFQALAAIQWQIK